MGETKTWDEDDLSWGELARRALTVVGVLMLGPALLTILLAMIFMMLPVAVVAIPFMVPVFFGEAAVEHEHELAHDSLPVLAPTKA